MRSNAAQYNLSAPESLDAILKQLSASPGKYMLVAGGTEIMVALGAGRLPAKNLLSIWNIPELRYISSTDQTLTIGAGATFTDIRNNPVIAKEFPLLAIAAGWTGSLANQNRATLGGNIVNASPAADSPPALLAYDAVIELISERGTRRMPYREFHISYKKTRLASDELVLCVHLSRSFSGYVHHARKVGTRNAQPISKIAIAALARIQNGAIEDIRIGAASLRDVPMRCLGVEQCLTGKAISDATIRAARTALHDEILPIDDIRSTAKYRSAVAGNLLEEFLRMLA